MSFISEVNQKSNQMMYITIFSCVVFLIYIILYKVDPLLREPPST